MTDCVVTPVAICIPTYNQAAYVGEAVRSALAQTHPVEVWVSDDCSTDDTPAHLATLSGAFANLRGHRHEANLGMAANTDWVVRQPRTAYLAQVDSDDRLHAEYVSHLLPLLEANPRAGYAHCAVRQIDAEGRVTRERRLRRATGYEGPDEALRAAVSGYRVAANICLFRRQALEDISFFRADAGFCKDWDGSVRLADAGWGNVYCDEMLADYRVWDDGAVRARRKLAEVEGCRRVFADSLSPAFDKRGWSPDPIDRQRRAMALVHATVLDSPLFTPAERAHLRRELDRLGASRALRARYLWLRLGMGPVMRGRNRVALAAKDLAKSVVRRAAQGQ